MSNGQQKQQQQQQQQSTYSGIDENYKHIRILTIASSFPGYLLLFFFLFRFVLELSFTLAAASRFFLLSILIHDFTTLTLLPVVYINKFQAYYVSV